MSNAEAYKILMKYGKMLNRKELKTIKGQINAGDTNRAIKGLYNILKRRVM